MQTMSHDSSELSAGIDNTKPPAETVRSSRGRFRPADRRLAAIAGIVVTALVLRQSWPTVTSEAPRWAALAEQQRQASIFTLPLFGFLGALAGSLVHRVNVGVTTTRSHLEMLTRHLGPLSVAATFGVIIGSLPAALSARNAPWGSVNVVEIVTFVAAATAAAAIGYLIATRVASKWSALLGTVAATALYAAPLALTSMWSGRSFLALAPSYGSFTVPPGWTDTLLSGLIRAMAFGLMLWAATAVVNRHRQTTLLTTIPLLTLAVFATGVVLRQPNLVEPTPRTACAQLNERSLCIPADSEAILPDITVGVQTLIDQFGTGAIPDNVDLGAYIEPNLHYTGETAQWLAAEQTAAAIVGEPTCYARMFSGEAGGVEFEARAVETRQTIGVLLARSFPDNPTNPLMAYDTDPNLYGPVAQDVASLSTDQISAIFAHHPAELANCSTSISQLLP